MAIEKGKFFEIIDVVSAIQGLNNDNLLQKVKEELYEVEQKLPEEDRGEYNKLKNDLWKDHLFSVKTSNGPVDYTLLHLAVEHTNVLIVELLLKKKVRVDIRVKDGSKDGPTALHIAALHGYQKLVQLLVDNNANPSLKNAQGQIPREMVGNVENKDDIVKILKKAEQSYSPKKAKDLNIKIEGGGSYHLYQNKHKTPTSSAIDENNVTAAPANVIDSHSKRYDSIHSIGSISDDSGLGLEQAQEEIKELKVRLGESRAQLKGKQEENKSLRQEIKNLESENATLKDELDKTKSQHSKGNEVLLEKAQEELAELKNGVAGHETRLEVFDQFDEENQSLKQQIQDLESKNTLFKGELEESENKHPKAEALLEKTQKELGESKSCIAGHETKLKEFNKENESLEQKIKNLESENATLNSKLEKTKTNEVPLEKAGKRQFFPRVAYASLAAMLAVGAALSFTSGLPVLLIIAISAVSALTAGGVTYAILKPDTELKEVDIQDLVQHNVCKA
jgi:cell division protein FtsB